MTAALQQVFTSATEEDARRQKQKEALITLLASGPAREITTALANINAAASSIRGQVPWYKPLHEDHTTFYMKHFEGRLVRSEDDSGYEQTFLLNQGHSGSGIAITFRDNGTMKIDQETRHYGQGAREVTESKTAYDDLVDVAAAQRQIGIFLALALETAPRQRLQTALANITPATGGPSLRPS